MRPHISNSPKYFLIVLWLFSNSEKSAFDCQLTGTLCWSSFLPQGPSCFS